MFFSPLSLSFAAPTGPLAAAGLCDLTTAAGNPCVAAHSTVRAMYSSYSGALYQVKRSDNSTMDVKVLTQGGYADAKAQDAFCGAANCVISSIYDQSPMGNHLAVAPPGGAHRERDAPVNATADPLTIGGHRAYSAYFEGGMGYRRDKTRGVATGDEVQTVYIQPSPSRSRSPSPSPSPSPGGDGVHGHGREALQRPLLLRLRQRRGER